MLCDLTKFNLNQKTVGVALSGGSDSVALFHFLLESRKAFGFKVCAVHVEHGIRGNDSVNDSLFVKSLCDKFGVPIIVFSVDAVSYSKEHKLSIEEGARAVRYDCFNKAISQGFCDVIATAHHQKDNAETVLFNLFRGTGLKGLTGINDVEDKIIRPLIDTKKTEIDRYVTDNRLEFVTDQTNFDQKYSRNYIRHKILPIVEEAFLEAENSISRFSLIAKEENDYLEKQTEKIVTFFDDRVEILTNSHVALIKRAIILALKRLGIKKDWEKIHIDDVSSLIHKENGKEISLPKGVRAVREYDKLVLFKEKPIRFSPLPVKPCEFFIDNKKFLLQAVDTPKNLKDALYVDLDKISDKAVIRLREVGDTFTKFGGGTVSLSNYFTDKKIPIRERDSIPVIADGNEILAVFGMAISNKVKIDDNTKKIIKLT